MKTRVWPGRPYPLGATWNGSGVNFALYSENASESRAVPVRFCGRRQGDLPPHAARDAATWSGTATCPTSCPARSTATACTGRTSRRKGHRFNPNKVLLDPYAKAIARETKWADDVWGYKLGDPQADLSFDERDSAAFAPLAAVIDEAFTWGDDRPPQTPWNKTIIYELHVKGFTQAAPRRAREAPRHLCRPGHRGRRSAICATWASRRSSCCRSTTTWTTGTWSSAGLVNYWGYNTLGFFAPEPKYASAALAQDTVREFKTMVADPAQQRASK